MLPEDPYTAKQSGATADGKFKFDGKTLDFTGFIDSRPFDGPLVDYHFVAQGAGVVADAPFNPQGFIWRARIFANAPPHVWRYVC